MRRWLGIFPSHLVVDRADGPDDCLAAVGVDLPVQPAVAGEQRATERQHGELVDDGGVQEADVVLAPGVVGWVGDRRKERMCTDIEEKKKQVVVAPQCEVLISQPILLAPPEPHTNGYPTNIGIVRCTVSVATIVVVSAGVDI